MGSIQEYPAERLINWMNIMKTKLHKYYIVEFRNCISASTLNTNKFIAVVCNLLFVFFNAIILRSSQQLYVLR